MLLMYDPLLLGAIPAEQAGIAGTVLLGGLSALWRQHQRDVWRYEDLLREMLSHSAKEREERQMLRRAFEAHLRDGS